jgi:hypothetical protein
VACFGRGFVQGLPSAVQYLGAVQDGWHVSVSDCLVEFLGGRSEFMGQVEWDEARQSVAAPFGFHVSCHLVEWCERRGHVSSARPGLIVQMGLV